MWSDHRDQKMIGRFHLLAEGLKAIDQACSNLHLAKETELYQQSCSRLLRII